MLLEGKVTKSKGKEGTQVVLISLRPRSYSDTIGQVIGQLRPELCVRVVKPAELADQVLRLHPNLVLCSRPRNAAQDGARSSSTSWVEYYPYAEPPEEEIRVNERGYDWRSVELSDLLLLVDRSLASV